MIRETQKPIRKLYGNYKKLQDIYDNQGLVSLEFYNQIIAYVKKLLNKYLYQRQFSEDNINDCFVLVYEKVSRNYDANKGCLGTFIHSVIRNYCTKINYRLVNFQTPISLDFEYINKDDLYVNILSDDSDSFGTEDEVTEYDIDNVEYYCQSLQCDNTLDKIEYYCDLIKQYEKLPELSSRDINRINQLDAVRKDLLWNVWKHNK